MGNKNSRKEKYNNFTDEKQPKKITNNNVLTLISKADKGDQHYQNKLGTWYKKGKNVKKDLKEALHWFRKSAEQGNSKALVNLGDCYTLGLDVKKDLVKAFELYEESAKKGNMLAINRVSECYMYGNGVKKNVKRSVKLCKLNAINGSRVAQFNMGFYYQYKRLTSNIKEAIRWYDLSYANGCEEALDNLSNIEYHYGHDLLREMRKNIYNEFKIGLYGIFEQSLGIKLSNTICEYL